MHEIAPSRSADPHAGHFVAETAGIVREPLLRSETEAGRLGGALGGIEGGVDWGVAATVADWNIGI